MPQKRPRARCALDSTEDGTKALDCTLDISQSSATFGRVFAAAATDLGKCLQRLQWSPARSDPDCSGAAAGVPCYYGWARAGQQAQLYGFSSGDPAVFGLGVYVTLPGR